MTWYVVIERETPFGEDLEPVVIGPFATEEQAADHGQDSLQVLDYLTAEAKLRGYIGSECYWTTDPPGGHSVAPDPPLDHGAAAQAAAEDHLAVCFTELHDELEADQDPPQTMAPFCGCETCLVREVLHAAMPHLELLIAELQAERQEAQP